MLVFEIAFVALFSLIGMGALAFVVWIYLYGLPMRRVCTACRRSKWLHRRFGGLWYCWRCYRKLLAW